MGKFANILQVVLPLVLEAVDSTNIRALLVERLDTLRRKINTLEGKARSDAERLYHATLRRVAYALNEESAAGLVSDLEIVNMHVAQEVREAKERLEVEPEVVEAEVVEAEVVEAEVVSSTFFPKNDSPPPAVVAASLNFWVIGMGGTCDCPLEELGADVNDWRFIREMFNRGRWSTLGFSPEEQAEWEAQGATLGEADRLRRMSYPPTSLKWRLTEEDRRRWSVYVGTILPRDISVGDIMRRCQLDQGELCELMGKALPLPTDKP